MYCGNPGVLFRGILDLVFVWVVQQTMCVCMCVCLSSGTAAFLWKGWLKKTNVCVYVYACVCAFLWIAIQRMNNLREFAHVKARTAQLSGYTAYSQHALCFITICVFLHRIHQNTRVHSKYTGGVSRNQIVWGLRRVNNNNNSDWTK